MKKLLSLLDMLQPGGKLASRANKAKNGLGLPVKNVAEKSGDSVNSFNAILQAGKQKTMGLASAGGQELSTDNAALTAQTSEQQLPLVAGDNKLNILHRQPQVTVEKTLTDRLTPGQNQLVDESEKTVAVPQKSERLAAVNIISVERANSQVTVAAANRNADGLISELATDKQPTVQPANAGAVKIKSAATPLRGSESASSSTVASQPVATIKSGLFATVATGDPALAGQKTVFAARPNQLGADPAPVRLLAGGNFAGLPDSETFAGKLSDPAKQASAHIVSEKPATGKVPITRNLPNEILTKTAAMPSTQLKGVGNTANTASAKKTVAPEVQSGSGKPAAGKVEIAGKLSNETLAKTPIDQPAAIKSADKVVDTAPTKTIASHKGQTSSGKPTVAKLQVAGKSTNEILTNRSIQQPAENRANTPLSKNAASPDVQAISGKPAAVTLENAGNLPNEILTKTSIAQNTQIKSGGDTASIASVKLASSQSGKLPEMATFSTAPQVKSTLKPQLAATPDKIAIPGNKEAAKVQVTPVNMQQQPAVRLRNLVLGDVLIHSSSLPETSGEMSASVRQLLVEEPAANLFDRNAKPAVAKMPQVVIENVPQQPAQKHAAVPEFKNSLARQDSKVVAPQPAATTDLPVQEMPADSRDSVISVKNSGVENQKTTVKVRVAAVKPDNAALIEAQMIQNPEKPVPTADGRTIAENMRGDVRRPAAGEGQQTPQHFGGSPNENRQSSPDFEQSSQSDQHQDVSRRPGNADQFKPSTETPAFGGIVRNADGQTLPMAQSRRTGRFTAIIQKLVLQVRQFQVDSRSASGFTLDAGEVGKLEVKLVQDRHDRTLAEFSVDSEGSLQKLMQMMPEIENALQNKGIMMSLQAVHVRGFAQPGTQSEKEAQQKNSRWQSSRENEANLAEEAVSHFRKFGYNTVEYVA